MGPFSRSEGCSLGAACWLLIAMADLAAGSRAFRLQWLWLQALSTGSMVVVHILICSVASSGPEIKKPVSLALQGRSVTTGPQGKLEFSHL